ncbi:TPA: hypothetical protein H1012_00280, partial [archaeon]|nr:hypothetical protein [Candidatus Naiadarchaeales archaeon SRR2090153.bin461]HIK02267.1 hypothetical protein [Candidatus Naiadarchaeales archaeon SRR2090159.bin1288]
KNIPCEIKIPSEIVGRDDNPLPDSLKIIKGLCEETCKKISPNEIIQFERFGFVKIEKPSPKSIKGILAHK